MYLDVGTGRFQPPEEVQRHLLMLVKEVAEAACDWLRSLLNRIQTTTGWDRFKIKYRPTSAHNNQISNDQSRTVR